MCWFLVVMFVVGSFVVWCVLRLLLCVAFFGFFVVCRSLCDGCCLVFVVVGCSLLPAVCSCPLLIVVCLSCGCSSVLVVRCSLCVVCCRLFVWLFFVVCCSLCVVCCHSLCVARVLFLVVVRCSLFIGNCVLLLFLLIGLFVVVVCCVMFVVCRYFFIGLASVVCQLLCVVCW